MMVQRPREDLNCKHHGLEWRLTAAASTRDGDL